MFSPNDNIFKPWTDFDFLRYEPPGRKTPGMYASHGITKKIGFFWNTKEFSAIIVVMLPLRKKKIAAFLFYLPQHQHQHLTKAPSAPKWLQAMKDPRKTHLKLIKQIQLPSPLKEETIQHFSVFVVRWWWFLFSPRNLAERNVWWTRRRTFLWLPLEYDGVCRNIYVANV